MSSSSEAVVSVPDVETLRLLLASRTRRAASSNASWPIKWIVRDDKIVVQGAPDAAARGAGLLEQLLGVARQSLSGGRPLAAADVRYLVQLAKSGEDVSKAESLSPIRCWFRNAASRSGRAPLARKATSKRCAKAISCLPSVPPVRVKLIWRWRLP
jgi:hypothetical protein